MENRLNENDIQNYANIQNLLISITNDNILATISLTKESILLEAQNYQKFCMILFYIIYEKRKLRKILASYCNALSNELNNKLFKETLLDFFCTKNEFMTYNPNPKYQFFYFCNFVGLYTINEYITKITESKMFEEDIRENAKDIYYILLYFAIQIKTNDDKLYQKIVDRFHFLTHNFSGFDKSLLRHWGHLPKYLIWITKEIVLYQDYINGTIDWPDRNSLIINSCLENSIEFYIQEDNIDQLTKELLNENIDIDSYKIGDHFLLLQDDGDSHLSLLQFAALNGSIKAFKYLYSNKKESKDFYRDQNLMSMAIRGGNMEIVRLLDVEKFDYSNCLESAFYSYNDALFQWVFQKYDCNIIYFLEEFECFIDFFMINFSSLLFVLNDSECLPEKMINRNDPIISKLHVYSHMKQTRKYYQKMILEIIQERILSVHH